VSGKSLWGLIPSFNVNSVAGSIQELDSIDYKNSAKYLTRLIGRTLRISMSFFIRSIAFTVKGGSSKPSTHILSIEIFLVTLASP
jgi:hypothetical protein